MRVVFQAVGPAENVGGLAARITIGRRFVRLEQHGHQSARVTPYRYICETDCPDAGHGRCTLAANRTDLPLGSEKTPEHRISFLTSACGDDEDLLRQVVSLLAKSGSTGIMVDRAREAVAGGQVETSDGLALGAKLGQYQILGPLGEGGMGKVYRALDTRLDRAVAIKISSERFSQRFEREARAFSALNHPHICTLYDVGSLPSGLSFMVTELVEGETLRDWLKRAPDLEQPRGCEAGSGGASRRA